MAYRVFISHSSADKDWVVWLAANAQPVGIEVYLYEYDSQPGILIAEKVKQAIKESDALVVLLTLNSQFSPYVQQEIGYAEAQNKRIIPLVQPGVDEPNLAMLQGREYIPFDFHRPETALSTLLSYLIKLKQAKENEQAVLMGVGALIVLALLLGGRE